MGVYVYTLRKKAQNVELPGGEIVPSNILGFLCRLSGMPQDTLFYGENDRYQRLNGAHVEAAQDRWFRENGPVYFMLDDTAQGYDLYRAENPSDIAVWYDCDRLEDEAKGITKVGRLGARTRRGRKLVWPVMTPEEEAAFDEAKRLEHERQQEEYRLRRLAAEEKRAAEKAEREQREAREAALNSAAL